MTTFKWDEEKNRQNSAKHGVSFELATLVFQDSWIVSIPDPSVQHEERWRSLGLIRGVLILFVVHTIVEEDEDEVIRIISARKATRSEREIYEKGRREAR